MSMKNQHKNIDEQLRDLESKSIPNLSHIDNHWKKLEGTGGVRIGFQKPLLWVTSIVIITSTILILTRLSEPTKQSPESLTVNTVSDQGTDTVPVLPKKRKAKMQSETSDPTDSLTFLSISDTVSKRKLPVKLYARKRIQPSNGSQNNLRRVSPKKVLLRAKTSTGVDTVFEAISVQEDSTAAIPTAQLLDEFFAQIATPSQTFTINNQYDTILVGRSGSLLFIPAGSFGEKKNVSIVLTEYYTKEEFIRNRLATMSGKQTLVSGGMVNVEAFENGKKIKIANGKKIKWYVDSKETDFSCMQLFEGRLVDKRELSNSKVDDVLTKVAKMDWWITNQQSFTRNTISTSFKVLDVRNKPYKTKERVNGDIGYFVIAQDPAISKQELRQELARKYNYKKVVLRTNTRRFIPLFGSAFISEERRVAETVGDSTWVDLSDLRQFKLTSTSKKIMETSSKGYFSVIQSSGVFESTIPTMESLLKEKYGVELRQLGWFNCDRFYSDPRPKTQLYVDIGDTALNYYTSLVFRKLNATLVGQNVGKTAVVFNDIPEGEEVLMVCVGVKDGKIRSTIQSFVTGSEKLTLTGFTETSPTSFKEKLAVLDK